jgi:sugar lactone lactonase YvrE
MRFLFLIAIATLGCTTKESYYVASDLTAENLFSENIEGPNYHNGILYVVNFEKDGTIGMIDEDGTAALFIGLPDGSTANSIQFNSKGDMLLADFTGHNILKVNMKTNDIEVLVHDSLFNQPNDLCINKNDQIFASDPNWKESTGKLWRIESNGTKVLLADSMGTTNGICLNPDEDILYVNESVQRKIWKFDVDASGNISNKTLFAEFPDFGFDGMKCDSKGNLYVTRYGKGTIVIITPEGDIMREVEMRGKKTSNIAFGGKDGKSCFVTLQDRKCVETFRTEVSGNR